jgi:hypothetical protein
MNDAVWSTGGMLQDKREILGEKISKCQFVHHKSQRD